MAMIRHAVVALSILALGAAPALAGSVVLRANPVDDDGRVTLGDLFDDAGAASGVVVAQRHGPSVVLEAAQLQRQARAAGLDWANPNGLRRVAVRRSSVAPTAAPTAGETGPAIVESAAFSPAPAPIRAVRAAAGREVIARNDMVRVTYQVGGVSLTVMGKAMRSAAVGEPVAVQNTTSDRIIDAVAVGPGQAVAGPAGRQARLATQQFAAR